MSAPFAGATTATGLLAAAELAPGTVLAGRFRIDGLLGIGGMGVVYRARDLDLDHDVAVKLLRAELAGREDAVERFRRELLLARQVASPHVVRIHDLARDGDRLLISMDLVEGESLERLLEREDRLDPQRAAGRRRDIAQGLAAAHGAGIVHRDLKPANVLVDASGHARISDFGVATSLALSGSTATGMVLGTPDYLSPEQARAGPVGPASDLYALGLIAYEMLTGKLPFAGSTAAEASLQRSFRAPPSPATLRPEVPRWLSRLVEWLLQPSPRRRPASAGDVVAAIDARRAPRKLPLSLPRLRPLLAAAAVALVAGATWWWATSAGPAAPDRIAVLPAEGEGPGDAMARALTEHLRLSLARSGLAVVDAERTLAALHQLGGELLPAGPGLPELSAALGAGRVVATRWDAGAGGAGQRLVLELLQPGDSMRADASAGSAVAAWGQAVPRLLDAVAPGRADPAPLSMPEAALEAWGQGLARREAGQLAEATRDFTSATVAAPGFLPAWLALAESARDAGRVDAAIAAASQALRQPGADWPGTRTRIAAMAASLDGEPARARELLGELLASGPWDARLVLELAQLEVDDGSMDAAVARLARARELDPDDARLWFLSGKLAILSGDARRAVDDFLVRALVLHNRAGHRLGQGETHNALGIGFERLGQLEQAVDNYERAITIRRGIGDERGLATSLRNLAAILAVRGDHAGAQARLDEARVLLERLRDRHGLAALDNDLGLLAEERGDHRAALAHYRDALARRQSLGMAAEVAESLSNVGFAHYLLGAYDDAAVYWQQALAAQQRIGDGGAEVRLRQNLAMLDIARGRWPEARAALEDSQRLAREALMVEEVAVGLRYLAELSLLAGDAGAAAPRLEEARQLFGEREDRRGLADITLLEARAAAVAGQPAAARERALAALDAGVALTADQRSELLLVALEAELDAGGDGRELAARTRASAQGTSVATIALGSRLLSARAGLEPAAPILDAARALGHASLHLRALELALAAQDDEALRLEAAQLLRRTGPWWRAPRLAAHGVVLPEQEPGDGTG